ncbi:MAG: hypothetical protein H0W83_16205 [Planctomycetes bacterium]|nr:hypothetical protein [Planctomycetota bacterium]
MNRVFQLMLFAVVLCSPAMRAAESDHPAATPAYKLVKICSNFMFAKNVDDVIAVLTKASQAGYNGVAITDSKFSRWFESVTVHRPEYDTNVKRLRQACRDLGLKFFAFSCDISNDLLSNDPNLAEGMPVIDAPFLVKNGTLVGVDEDFAIVNGSFEQSSAADRPTGWSVDDPGSVCFVDTEVASEGTSSLRIQDIKGKNAHGNGRIFQTIAVKPFRYYHLSLMVKTRDFVSADSIHVWVHGKQDLEFPAIDLKTTQDWTRIDIPFNTLDSTEVSLRIGSWGGVSGSLWIDDVRVEPGGFVNLLRRESLPFSITSVDRRTVYVEGTDVADVKDPKTGNTDWPGLYKDWYGQPSVRVPVGSRLKEGDRVLVGYSHASIVYGYGVFACLNEAKVWPLIERNLHELHTVLQPDGYIMPYDEIRQQGWDDGCVTSGKTPVANLIAHTRKYAQMIRAEDPGKPIFAWSDLYDPYHNAQKKGEPYYLVKGIDPWVGSWEGLDKDIVILNWHGHPEKRAESLRFFADRGNRQVLCGFYDATSDNMVPWLKEAEGLKGIDGFMYTTWGNNYSELSKFLDVVAPPSHRP